MERRRVLTLVGGGVLGSLAGCDGQRATESPGEETTQPPRTTESPTQTPHEPTPQQPANCPVIQDLDVEWPDEITGNTVGEFVERYEQAYYREVVVEYEPKSRFDAYSMGVGIVSVTASDEGGFRVEVDGSGAVFRPVLVMRASVVDEEPKVDVVPLEDVEDVTLRELLQSSANDPEDDKEREVRGSEVDRYADLFNDLPSDGTLDRRGSSATVYFDVDSSAVELTVRIASVHGDYWWGARYYVDESVVRRTDVEEALPPEEGELLECRVEN